MIDDESDDGVVLSHQNQVLRSKHELTRSSYPQNKHKGDCKQSTTHDEDRVPF